jgi:uncharacterized membrane protein
VTAGAWALFLAVFLACAVEAVEATTIVLAAGTARDWRSAATGTGAALVALAVIVGLLGPAVSAIPLHVLRLVIGALLLVFGLQWLRKAILRASGHKALHDEDRIYREQLAAASDRDRKRAALVPDWYGFTLAFKGVLLEGLEVAFIVLTFGANQHDIGLAAVAAGCAVLVIAGIGVAVRAPLARVPENTLKFIVGIMLTSFGTLWGAEGAGAHWPGSDAALLVIIPAVAVLALGLIAAMRHADRPGSARKEQPEMSSRLRGFAAFWYDFVIGDDWLIAAGIVAALLGTYLLSHAGIVAWWLLPLLVAVVLPVSLWRAIRDG